MENKWVLRWWAHPGVAFGPPAAPRPFGSCGVGPRSCAARDVETKRPGLCRRSREKSPGLIPQIAGSYRGSNFSKGGIVLANWPTSGCCSECCAGCCQGCCCGCCPGCSGSCLPLGGVRVLSRVLCRGAVQGAPDHVCHWVVSRCCPGSPDHVCHWAVSGCCPGLSRVLSGCSGSCLPLGGVRVLCRVLCRGAVQDAPDHVCHWAVSGCCPGWCAGVLFRVLRIMFAIGVSGCCPGCSGSCLPLGGVRVLSRVLSGRSGSCLPLGGVRVLSRVLCRGAIQGAPDHLPLGGVNVLFQGVVRGAPDHVCHWAVSGCCPGCCSGCSDHVCHWAVSGC